MNYSSFANIIQFFYFPIPPKFFQILKLTVIYILLHDWEGNTERYLFEIDCIGPTEGRENTKVENRIFPSIARP